MDHFFNSAASLMSNLLRTTVKKSIYDLVELLEEYHEGNDYEGNYNIMDGLGLPIKFHPITIYMVRMTFLYSLERTCFVAVCIIV